MNIEKIAAKDAAKWAEAELFFGEGAGTRRKLLSADIGYKTENVSEYYPAFKKAYDSLNFSQLAMNAAKERQSIDRMNMVSKNARAIIRGDRRGLSTGVAIVVGIAWVAHQTGYDKKALIQGKKYYKKAKAEFALRKYRYNYNKSQKEQQT